MSINSAQQRMNRLRPPRVNITYEIDIGNATEQKELPMVIGLISNLGESKKNAHYNALINGFIPVKKNQLNQAIAHIQPTLNLVIAANTEDSNTEPIINVQIQFHSMQDFHPDAIVTQNPELNTLANKRKALAVLRNRLIGQTSLQKQLQKYLKKT